MYTPDPFVEDDLGRLHALIEAHAFATLIVPDGGGGVETAHLPFLLDRDAGPRGRLRAHVARANPIWASLTQGRPVIVVFSGPHGYVSPRWYEEPGRRVPTWNYLAVHAHGRAEGPMDRGQLGALLDDLVAVHERDAAAPWSLADLDPALGEALVGEIVGFSIAIERLEGKFKLSQNRSPADRARVIDALRARGSADDLAMVAWMTDALPPR